MIDTSHVRLTLHSFTLTLKRRMASQHHPSLYFPTGDLVLSAPVTGEGLGYGYFRIDNKHVGDIANLESSQTYDGVPLVKLSDSASKLAALLDVIYNGCVDLRSSKNAIVLTPSVPLATIRGSSP